jgi:2-desacetyl-2-hydroxyethyl bacteriochlorophyllide A dehydrogenase
MTATCRAVVFNGDGTYEIRDFRKPGPPKGGALLKVEAVGMCSSDVMQLAGHKHVPGEVSPVVAGHEIVGRVEELADDADLGVSVGDRVAVDLINRKFAYGGSRLVVYGYTLGLDDESGLWGGYGEYMCVLPGTHLLKLTESLPAEHMTLYEPLANAVNWASLAGIGEGDTVVVLGPGHVGLMCVVAAKAAGARNIIVTGTSTDRLRLDAALTAGAQHAIDVDAEDPVERVREITRGRLADVVMEVTSMSTRAVQQAFQMVGFTGTVLLAGLKNNTPVELVTDDIVFRGLTVKGGAGSTPDSMRAATNLINQGKVPTDDLLGEVFTLDRFDEAMSLLKREHPDRDAIKVTIRHG